MLKTVLTLTLVAAATATIAVVVLVTTGDEAQRDGDRAGRSTQPAASGGDGSPPVDDQPTTPSSNASSAPAHARQDARTLGRWVANLAFGLDYRNDRDSSIEALWSITLGADSENDDAVPDAFAADDPGFAGIVNLVPDRQTWARMADHDQWSEFEVHEPVGAREVELDVELTRAGVTTTMVLVTGTQTIHYTGEDGSTHTQTLRPSLQMLIGCANRWDGCRLLRIVDRQP